MTPVGLVLWDNQGAILPDTYEKEMSTDIE